MENKYLKILVTGKPKLLLNDYVPPPNLVDNLLNLCVNIWYVYDNICICYFFLYQREIKENSLDKP